MRAAGQLGWSGVEGLVGVPGRIGGATVTNADLSYDVGGGQFPLITTRKSYWKSAIAELLGYLRGKTMNIYTHGWRIVTSKKKSRNSI